MTAKTRGAVASPHRRHWRNGHASPGPRTPTRTGAAPGGAMTRWSLTW